MSDGKIMGYSMCLLLSKKITTEPKNENLVALMPKPSRLSLPEIH